MLLLLLLANNDVVVDRKKAAQTNTQSKSTSNKQQLEFTLTFVCWKICLCSNKFTVYNFYVAVWAFFAKFFLAFTLLFVFYSFSVYFLFVATSFGLSRSLPCVVFVGLYKKRKKAQEHNKNIK